MPEPIARAGEYREQSEASRRVLVTGQDARGDSQTQDA
jgi:hypothetical protein